MEKEEEGWREGGSEGDRKENAKKKAGAKDKTTKNSPKKKVDLPSLRTFSTCSFFSSIVNEYSTQAPTHTTGYRADGEGRGGKNCKTTKKTLRR